MHAVGFKYHFVKSFKTSLDKGIQGKEAKKVLPTLHKTPPNGTIGGVFVCGGKSLNPGPRGYAAPIVIRRYLQAWQALVGISPVAAVVKAQAGTAVKGAERPAACGGLPLTGGPACAIPCGAAGVYPPEPPPFPWDGGGGGRQHLPRPGWGYAGGRGRLLRVGGRTASLPGHLHQHPQL